MSGKGKGIKPLELGLLQTEAEHRALLDAAMDDKFRRLAELADAKGIPEGPCRWALLALKLAEENEPAFKPARTDGAKKKWSPEVKTILVNWVALAMHDNGWTKTMACDQLADAPPRWLPKSALRRGGEAFSRQCSNRALKSAQGVLADAVAVGMLEDFRRIVSEGIELLELLENEREQKTEKSSGGVFSLPT